jgi:hypothetical protein
MFGLLSVKDMTRRLYTMTVNWVLRSHEFGGMLLGEEILNCQEVQKSHKLYLDNMIFHVNCCGNKAHSLKLQVLRYLIKLYSAKIASIHDV